MWFDMKELKSSREKTVPLLSIHIDPSLLREFEEEGFMFGVKLSFNKRVLCFARCFELFQSVHKDGIGCLGENDEWAEQTVFYRRTITLGRLKFYLKSGQVRDRSMVVFEGCIE